MLAVVSYRRGNNVPSVSTLQIIIWCVIYKTPHKMCVPYSRIFMAVVTARFPPAESPTSTMCSPVVPGQRDHMTETHNFKQATHIMSAENLHNTLMFKGEICLL